MPDANGFATASVSRGLAGVVAALVVIEVHSSTESQQRRPVSQRDRGQR